MKRSTLLSLSVLLLSASWAAAAQTTDVRPGLGGISETRTVTTAGDAVSWPVAQAQRAPRPMTGGSILWVDTNSLSAIAEIDAISGDGTYGIAGWWLNNKRVAVYQISGDNVPEWTHPMVAAFQISVGADLAAHSMVATGRGDSCYVFTSSTSRPVHSDWYTPPLVGYQSAVSSSGNTYAAAGGNPDGTAGEFRVYDGSGALRFLRTLPTTPEGAAVSADGLVAAVTVRPFVKVFDAMTGALRDSVAIPQQTQTGSVLSGDGSYLATAGLSNTVRLYHWNGTHYALAWSYNIPGTTWVPALAISADGSTLAAGTWTNPTGGDVVAFSTGSATPLWTDSTFGDEVESVAVSSDGSRIAAADWGRDGATVGNIISVYDRTSSTPVFGVADDQLTGVGSAEGIGISNDGQYVFAGGKAVHAREFGSGGWTMALQVPVVSAVRVGPGAPATLLAWPNPSNGPVRFSLSGAAAGGPNATGASGDVLIAGADGRRVRRCSSVSATGTWLWDGRDESGRAVPAGTYFARIVTAGGANGSGGSIRVVRAN